MKNKWCAIFLFVVLSCTNENDLYLTQSPVIDNPQSRAASTTSVIFDWEEISQILFLEIIL